MEYVDVVVMENMLFIVMDNINLLVVNILDKGDWDFIYKLILLDNKIEEVSVIFRYVVIYVKVYWFYVKSGNFWYSWWLYFIFKIIKLKGCFFL